METYCRVCQTFPLPLNFYEHEEKLRRYPTAIRQHTHVTKAHLPVDVAKALAVNPSFVQKAVEAFYTRDALQLRVSGNGIYGR